MKTAIIKKKSLWSWLGKNLHRNMHMHESVYECPGCLNTVSENQWLYSKYSHLCPMCKEQPLSSFRKKMK